MYHYHHRYPLESDQKDLYISELKAENFELRHRQGAHIEIRDKIAATEHEIAMINDERRRIEDDMVARKAEDEIIINEIRRDNDALRATLSVRDSEILDLKAQIDALRREDDDLSVSLNSITADINAVENHNANLRADLPQIEDQLGDERAIGRRLRNDLDKAKANHSSLNYSIKILEEQLAKNKLNEADLRRILDDRTAEYDDKNARLRALEDEIASLRMRIDDRDKEVFDLNRRYGVQIDINNKQSEQLNRQLSKNADLDLTVRRLEDELAILDKDITYLRTDVERLTIVLEDASSANKGLEDELNALNSHAQLLESQNADLTRELDGIIVTDERIRADLDRKQRLAALQHRNDEEMRHSINRLTYTRSMSPVRSISRSPVRRY